MIVRAWSGTVSGIHSQLRKRGQEDRIHSGEDDKSAFSARLIAAQDGKVDVCLDVDKVEARWDTSKVRFL